VEEARELAALDMKIKLNMITTVISIVLALISVSLAVYSYKNRSVSELSYHMESLVIEDDILRDFGYSFYDLENKAIERRPLQFVRLSLKNTGNQIVTPKLIRETLNYSEHGLGVEFLKSTVKVYTQNSDGLYSQNNTVGLIEVKLSREKKIISERREAPKEALAREKYFTLVTADSLAIAEIQFEHIDPGDVIEIDILMTSQHVSKFGFGGKISTVELKPLGHKIISYGAFGGFSDPFKMGSTGLMMRGVMPPVFFDKDLDKLDALKKDENVEADSKMDASDSDKKK